MWSSMKRSAVLSLFLTSTVVQAAFDLQVSEIWPGQDGSDVTQDWFEIANLGDEIYTAATDGALWYMDQRDFDATDVVQITGIPSLAPNAVAIVLIGDVEDETEVKTEFSAEWPNTNEAVIGYAGDGKGLGQNDDAVQLWLSATAPTMDDADIVASYSHATVMNAASYLPLEMAFSVNGEGGAATSTSLGGDDGDTVDVDESDTAAVGSPGFVFVPEMDQDDGCVMMGFICTILGFPGAVFAFFRSLLPF